MNAREVLVELQKVPRYAEGKPDYGAMLKVFGERRADVARVISGLEMCLGNPFDSIDSYVANAERNLAGAKSEDMRKGLQRTASLYFRSTYESELNGLDFYNKMQTNQIGIIEKFQREYKAQDAYSRQQGAKRVAFIQGIEEVKAIKELAKLYAQALLSVRKMEFLLKES